MSKQENYIELSRTAMLFQRSHQVILIFGYKIEILAIYGADNRLARHRAGVVEGSERMLIEGGYQH